MLIYYVDCLSSHLVSLTLSSSTVYRCEPFNQSSPCNVHLSKGGTGTGFLKEMNLQFNGIDVG